MLYFSFQHGCHKKCLKQECNALNNVDCMMKFMVVAGSFLLTQLLIGILQRYSFQNIHILIYILQLQIRPSINSYSLILTLKKIFGKSQCLI